MSEIYKAINDIVESKLLELHTAFLAKVVAVNGKKYSIKPLAKYKQYGKEAQEYPVITNVYRTKGMASGKSSSSAHSHTVESTTTSTESLHEHTVPQSSTSEAGGELDISVQIPIKEGDIVLCVALERDITNLVNGQTNLPFTGVHHRINDAIIIDVVDL